MDADTRFWQIESSLDRVAGLAEKVLGFAVMRVPGIDRFGLELVVRELLVNAIEHGHRNLPDARVALSVTATGRSVRIQVDDEGPGFDWRAGMRADIPNPTALGGRGLPLIKAYCQEIEYNEKGNSVTVALIAGEGG